MIPEISTLQVNNKIPEFYNTIIPHLSPDFRDHEGNVVAVCCFPDLSSSHFSTHIVEGLQDENTRIIFDNVHEGHVLGPLDGIYTLVERLHLNPKNCYFFSGGLEAESLHDTYCAKHHIVDRINIRILLAWERSLNRNTTHQPVFEVAPKENLFLCFNRQARLHRVAFLGLMYDRGLVPGAHISFFSSLYGMSLTTILRYLRGHVSLYMWNCINTQIVTHLHEFPLTLNVDSIEDNVNYVKDDDSILYATSQFSVVTETFFFKVASPTYDEVSVFFSEKIFKPIICKHPFIQLNRPRALRYLKELGYHTFHPFIDESYDEIENDEERLLAIVNEIKRLNGQTPEEWERWQINVAPIVEHNYRTLKHKTQNDHTYTMRNS